MQEPFTPPLPENIEGFPLFGHLRLERIENARDLGGMPVEDGRRIRSGRLIRSGNPHGATDADCELLLLKRHLTCIFDLRTGFEVEASPDPVLNLPDVTYIHASALHEDFERKGPVASLARDVSILRDYFHDAQNFMHELYVKCVMEDQGIRTYRGFFQVLLDANSGSVLWHCTQGKDRTGIAAFLIEYALGVSEHDRWQDYLATNLYMSGWAESMEKRLRTAHQLDDFDFDLESYVYANPQNLHAALDAINEGFGSLPRYLGEALGVGRTECEQLRAMYLE